MSARGNIFGARAGGLPGPGSPPNCAAGFTGVRRRPPVGCLARPPRKMRFGLRRQAMLTFRRAVKGAKTRLPPVECSSRCPATAFARAAGGRARAGAYPGRILGPGSAGPGPRGTLCTRAPAAAVAACSGAASPRTRNRRRRPQPLPRSCGSRQPLRPPGAVHAGLRQPVRRPAGSGCARAGGFTA